MQLKINIPECKLMVSKVLIKVYKSPKAWKSIFNISEVMEGIFYRTLNTFANYLKFQYVVALKNI